MRFTFTKAVIVTRGPLTSPTLLSRLTPTPPGEEGDGYKKLLFKLPSLPGGRV